MTPLRDLARRLAAWETTGDLVGARTFDALAAFRAGAATGEGRAISAFARSWDAGPPNAVLRAVATVRLTELDDIHMPTCTTPGSVVVPTAVVVAADLGADAGAYRRAVEVGYEALTRLGAAVDGAHVVYRGVWPTYFGAPFSAAAVVAALLDLDPERTANALGLALTRATGLTSGIGGSPLGRWLTVGDAARAGCAAAFAARDGFVADVDLDRVAAAAGIELDAVALLRDAAPAVETVSVKPFPTAKQSLAAAEAALRLRDRIEPGAPVRVHVPEAYAHMVAGPALADSRLSRVSSARWNVALALARPAELHDVERAAMPDDPQLGPLAGRVEVVPDPELSPLFPQRWPARVESGGLAEAVVDATGDPALGNGLEAVEAKWRDRSEDVAALREPALAADVCSLARALDTPTVRP